MTKATVDVVGKQIFINGQEVEVTPDSMFVTGIDELDKPLVVHVALVVEDLTIQRKAEPENLVEKFVDWSGNEVIVKNGDAVTDQVEKIIHAGDSGPDLAG